MLEYHVDTLTLRQLAHLALEPFSPIIDDVIGPKRLRLLAFGVVSDRCVNRTADSLGHLDRRRADTRSASVNQNAFARL